MAVPSDQKPSTIDWEQKRQEFLSDPKHGFLDLFESLNRKISASVAPGRRTWKEVSGNDQFQQAFDFVTDRLLTVDGFRNICEKHRDSGTNLTLGEFMDNRINLVLAEWCAKRNQEPTAVIRPDEHIEQQGSHGPAGATQSLGPNFTALLQRIKQLSECHAASLSLMLWPLPTFPELWRDTLLPLILNCGEKNGLNRHEVKRRLDEVIGSLEAVLNDDMVEREVRLGLHFEKTKLFDRRKRSLFGELHNLNSRGEYSPQSGVEHELRCDCQQAVQKESEASVKMQFADDEIYVQLPSGLRRVKNRPLWYRRRFSCCCYKQKYHRRCWLNVSMELLVQKPVDGPMSYAGISYILNCPENTTAANLRRARKSLQIHVDAREDDHGLVGLHQTDIDAAKAKWTAELQPDRLQAFICEDLKPQVIQLSGKSGS